jgi:hypothetical protein
VLRYKQKFAVAGLAGLLAVVALTIAATPSGATLVCPPGVTNPAYCTNVPPVAITQKATDVRAEQAFLNGVVGPNVANGDSTMYFFEYGKTKSYGNSTPSGTVGGPAATRRVSYRLRGLTACTTYHYRVNATNSDGSATGGDKSFKTGFLAPIKSVHAPRSVPRSRPFTVTVKLTTPADLSVKLERTINRGHHRFVTETVSDYSSKGSQRGTVNVTFRAPSNTGRYTIVVTASESCGKQTVSTGITVF